MRTTIVCFIALAAVANARPDVSLGYNYNNAQDAYTGPTPNHDALTLATHQTVEQQGGYHTGAIQSTAETYANTAYQSEGHAHQELGTAHQSAASVEPSHLPPIITKSFYFEAAPEEPEEHQAPRFVSVGRAQKNYKVIFIKAPSYGLNSQIIPVLPQNEEKTIIYVLSKKPELNQDIELPPVPTTEPTKPDIFFVKYKSEQEALDAQHKIKNVYETNQPIGADGEAHFNDGHIHSIVSEVVPNVYSAAAGLSTSSHTRQDQLNAHHHATIGQRFGGEADEGDEALTAILNGNGGGELQATIVADAENAATVADGFQVVSSEAEAEALGQQLNDATNNASDLIQVNILDINNAAAPASVEHAVVSAMSTGEPDQDYLPPSHEHEQQHH